MDRTTLRLLRAMGAAGSLAVLLLSLGGAARAQQSVVLVGSGSSLPEPLYLLWNDEFHKQNEAILVRYLPVGTGESANRILNGTGDFGGGDAPIPEKQLKAAGNPIVELPSVLIGIVVAYNLPGLPAELKLSGPVAADIYLGKITSWDDPEITKLNPGVKLPGVSIVVLHRTEGKGSSYIFSDYLSKVSPEFQTKVGRSSSPKWPVGQAIGRTQDMLEKVKATPGAIGYTELNWAVTSGLRIARIRNAAGEYVKASQESIAAAATSLEGKMTEDFRVSLTNAPGKDSYPISSFTWLYVPAKAKDTARGHALVDYLSWIYTSGQGIAARRGYAPLPPPVLRKVRARAATIR